MSLSLVLFDEDGFTTVVDTCRVGVDVREGERCTLYIGGKKYLVEILKTADKREDLDAFERGWANSSRGSVIDMRKELLDGKKGGYLDCKPLPEMTTTYAEPVVKLLPMNLNTTCNVTPKQITSENLSKDQKSLSMRLKKPMKKVLKKAADCVKSVTSATRHLQKKTVYTKKKMRRGKENVVPVLSRPINNLDECQNATPRSSGDQEGNIRVPVLESRQAKTRSSGDKEGNTSVPDSVSSQPNVDECQNATPRSSGDQEGNIRVPVLESRQAKTRSSGDKEGNTSVPDSVSSQPNVVMPRSVPRAGSKRKPGTVITGGSKRVKLAATRNEEYPKLLERKKLPKKIGTSKRELAVLFEGDMDVSTLIQEPRRQPVMTDHMTEDQSDCVLQQVELFKNKKVNVSVQTDPVIVFKFDKDVQDFERNKKYLEILVTVNKIHETLKNITYSHQNSPSINKPKTPQTPHNLSTQVCSSVTVPSMNKCDQMQPLNLTVNTMTQEPPIRQHTASVQRQHGSDNNHVEPYKDISNQQPLNLTLKKMTQEPPMRQPTASVQRQHGSNNNHVEPYKNIAYQQPLNLNVKTQEPPIRQHTASVQMQHGSDNNHVEPYKNIAYQQPLNLNVKTQQPPIRQPTASVQRQHGSDNNHMEPYKNIAYQQPLNLNVKTQEPPIRQHTASAQMQHGSDNNHVEPYKNIAYPQPLNLNVKTQQPPRQQTTQLENVLDEQFTDNTGSSLLADLLTVCEILPTSNTSESSEFLTATPLTPTQPLQTISPDMLRQISSEVQKTPTNFPNRPLFEIGCCTDILSVPKEANVTVSKDLRNNVRMKHGHSPTSFGWQLARALFSDDELDGKNFHGRGRAPLSPRRREAIKLCIESCYPERTDLQPFVDGINAGIRNLRRRKLSNLRFEL